MDPHGGALHARESSVGACVERRCSAVLGQPGLHGPAVLRGAEER